MLFKKLVLENIRSYKDLTIEFPRGSILLAGNIGSGKTSILLGLQFALFGLQPGQKGSSILRQGKDKASTQLDIEINGELATLKRTIRRSKSGSITQDSSMITIDGESKELSTMEMKEQVIKLLNYPKEFTKKSNLLYKFTVYTPQEEMKAIVQEKPEVRLNTLRHLFGIDRYKRIKENAEILLKKIKDAIKLKEVLASELNLLKEKFTSENEKKIVLTRGANEMNLNYQKLIKIKKESENKLTIIQNTIDKKKELDSEIEKVTILLQGKIDLESRMKKEVILMQKQIHKKSDFSEEKLKAVSELLKKHQEIIEDRNSKFLAVSSQISVLNSKKERPLKLKNQIISLENCPTCLQSVGQDHKHKIETKLQYDIEDVNRELEQKLQQKQILIKDIEKEKKLIKGYELDKSSLQQEKIKYEHQKTIETKIKSDAFILERTSNEIINLKDKIKQTGIKSQTFSQAQENFNLSKKEFQNIKEKIRVKEIAIATQNKELELLKIKLEELSKEIQDKEKTREQINHLRGLQGWVQKNFITLVDSMEKIKMAQLRKEFSRIFKDWFSILVSDSLLARLDEDFTPIITNQDYEIDYDFLSGGERTATALAYRLSLNQVLNSQSYCETSSNNSKQNS
jgi:exonuclease SbcC